MSLPISLSFASNLPTLLHRKIASGRYAKDGYRLSGSYEADLGWDNLFADYLSKRAATKRAGATAVDISAPDIGEKKVPGVSEATFTNVTATPEAED